MTVDAGKAPRNPRFPNEDPRLMFALARDHLRAQEAALNAIETKLIILLALASVLVTLLVAILAVQAPLACGAIVLGTISGLLFVSVAGSALVAMWPRRWTTGPKLPLIWADHGIVPLDQLTWRVVADFINYAKGNEPARVLRLRMLRTVIVLTVLQTVTGIIALLAALA